MVNEWTKEPVAIELVVVEEKPLGDAEQLAQVMDVLGTLPPLTAVPERPEAPMWQTDAD